MIIFVNISVFNTSSKDHPYVDYMETQMGIFYVGGPITEGLRLPQRNWIPLSRHRVATPTGMRRRIESSFTDH